MKKAYVFLANFAVVYLGSVSTLMLFIESFHLPVKHIPLLVLIFALISTAIFSLPKFRLLAFLSCLALIGFWAYGNLEMVADGLSMVVNTVTTRVGQQFSVDVYTGSSSGGLGACGTFISLLATVVSLFLGWTIARHHSGFLSLLITLPIFILSISLTANPNKFWIFILVLYWLLVLLPSVVKSVDDKLGIRVLLVTLPCAAALLLLIGLLFPESRYERAKWPDQLYIAIQTTLESALGFNLPESNASTGLAGNIGGQWRFDTGEIDLYEVGPRRYSGKTLLQINTEAVGVRYLRGYSMSRYTGESWVNDSPADYSAISPDPIYSSVIREGAMTVEPLLLAGHAVNGAESEIEITNIADQSGVVYTPYFSRQLYAFGYEESKISAPSEWLNTAVTISFVNAPLDLTSVTQNTYIAESEAIYRQYVYDTYLNIPDYLAQQLRALASEAGITPEMGSASIAGAVAEYMSGAAQYSLNTPFTPQGEDFVLYFLTQSKQGYCMHFASAATAMLQALGVPARYVTGYVKTITEEAAGTDIDVLDNNAHAWVEVYLDGIGWAPYEVTGGSGAPQSAGAAATAPPTAPTEVSAAPSLTPYQTPNPGQPGSGENEAEKKQASPLWLLLLMIPVAAAGIILRRALGIIRRSRQPDNMNKAAIETWTYILKLHQYGGGPPEALHELALKARFSQHMLSAGELQQLTEYAQDLAEETDARLSPLKRFIFRYIKALY